MLNILCGKQGWRDDANDDMCWGKCQFSLSGKSLLLLQHLCWLKNFLFFLLFSLLFYIHKTPPQQLSFLTYTQFWRNFPTSSQLYYSTPHLPSRLSYSVLCMFHIKLICFSKNYFMSVLLLLSTYFCICTIYVEVGNICFKHFAMSFMFLCLGFLG